MKLLVVTAVAAERDAIGRDGVVVGGVGPAASAAATSAALAAARYDLVVCAGIGGGFAPLRVGDIAVASCTAFADLGADSPDGFVPFDFATDRYDVAPRLGVELADRTGGHLGTVLTVATVTGTAAGAAALLARYPDAVAEGMEGAGVAAAATLHGVPFAEIRAVSNPVGPRDREAWRVAEALEALGMAVNAVAAGWQL
ncbi:MAG TPA: futalosine hydrolase [Jatrophihabitantaceae bacterium]